MDRLARFCVDQRLLVCVLLAALSVPPALGWLGYRWRTAPPPSWVGTEDFEAIQRAQRNFTFAAPVILVLESADFFTSNRLTALRRTVGDLRSIADVDQVVWIGDVATYSLTGSTPVLPADDATPEQLASSKNRALEHPLVAENLLAANGRTMLMLLDAPAHTVDEIRTRAQSRLSPVGVRVRVTGPVPLYQAHDRALAEDHIRIQLLVYALVAVLAVLIFRQPLAIVVAGIGPVVGVVWSMGWVQLLGESHNELAQIILPVMVMMIGFTDGVHVVVHIRQRRATGEGSRESVVAAVRHVGPACFLTSVTTAIGFGSLQLSGSGLISGFGRVAAIGVVLAFVAVILITPLLANSIIGKRIHVAQSRDPIARLMQGLLPVVSLTSRHARLVSVSGVVLTILLFAVSLRLVPNDRLADRVPHRGEAWQAMQHCDREMGGIRYVQLVVTWSDDISPGEIWNTLGEVEDVLRSEPRVGKPISIRTCVSVFAGAGQENFPMLAALLPVSLRDQFYQPQQRSAQIVARLQDLGIATYDSVFARIEERCGATAAARPGLRIELASDLLLEGRVVRRMVNELVRSLLVASVIIFSVLGLAFRSLRLALLSIVPNVMPLAASGAVRYFIDQSLDIASACSFAVCLGIAVDDTIHYLNRFRRERAAGADTHTANRRTFQSVGSALVMTSAVMIAGMGTVVTSQLPTHSSFAIMGCVTLTAALVADLVFLPALLAWFDSEKVAGGEKSR